MHRYIHNSIIYSSQDLELPKFSLVDEWMVHSHNGILRNSEREGILTFCDSMDGTGDYYVK